MRLLRREDRFSLSTREMDFSAFAKAGRYDFIKRQGDVFSVYAKVGEYLIGCILWYNEQEQKLSAEIGYRKRIQTV